MAITFYDRQGAIKTPEMYSIIKSRKGVWTLAKAEDAVLLLWPSFTNNIPDLPGGGVEEGETLEQALQREWYEETGLLFEPVTEILGQYHHVRGFYADGPKEYWIYDQTFFLYGFERHEEIGHKWLNPEGDQAGWARLEDLPKLSLNRAHWCAVEALMPECC